MSSDEDTTEISGFDFVMAVVMQDAAAVERKHRGFCYKWATEGSHPIGKMCGTFCENETYPERYPQHFHLVKFHGKSDEESLRLAKELFGH